MDDVGSLENALPNGIHMNVHVEVCQKRYSTVKGTLIKEHVLASLKQKHISLTFSGEGEITQFEEPFLQEHVKSLRICDAEELVFNKKGLDLSNTTLHIHVYRLHEDGPAQEELDEEEEIAAANHWLLPATEFHGLWENLIFDSDVKNQLLQYASTTLLFSDRHIDNNIISWNKVVLLHGPPGTGKTSLCKALAQKLCIQLSDRYSYGQLIEINSHSLFSKWFSESGKLVMKMFQKIQDLVDDKEALVFVLMDEVESLTAARKSAMNGMEPSDAIRVVNALLTQLDQIKVNNNVMILTTSNITGAIDLAFVDRADIKQYIGPPSPAAIYTIYKSCVKELMKASIILPKENIMELRDLEVMSVNNHFNHNSLKLKHISIKSESLSGRTLRKLPFIAHAAFLHKPCSTLGEFLEALERTVEKQFQERRELAQD